jgi:hypothetical protein
MKRRQRSLLLIAGIMSTAFGIIGAIPGFLQSNYVLATVSTLFMVGGLVIIAIAFGD